MILTIQLAGRPLRDRRGPSTLFYGSAFERWMCLEYSARWTTCVSSIRDLNRLDDVDGSSRQSRSRHAGCRHSKYTASEVHFYIGVI